MTWYHIKQFPFKNLGMIISLQVYIIYSCLVNYIQSLVFGGVDGIITSFAVVAAIAGAGYSTFYILAIGIANLVGDAFSMGS